MTESQKQFELWCRNNPLKTDKDKRGFYKYQSTHFAFMAWQASRSTLVVKLPRELEVYNDRSGYVLELVRDSLDRAGLSYE